MLYRFKIVTFVGVMAIISQMLPFRLLLAAESAKHHVNPVTWYQVDPTWPKRPAEMKWGQMPGVAVDNKDNVWLFTRAEIPVQVYAPSGDFVQAWGKGEIGSAHFLRFDKQGNVWLADVGNHVVMQYSRDGKLLKTFGTRGSAGDDSSHFNKPTDMAVAPNGDIFVTDGYGNSRVVHFDKNGHFIKAWGKQGNGPGEFNLPHSIVMDSKGRLYVADRNNARVQVFNQSGKFLAQWNNLIIPYELWITPEDEIWACGSSPQQWLDGDYLGVPPKDQLMMKLDSSGKVLQLWTFPKGEDGKEKPGEINLIHGIAVDSKGDVYIGDISGARAQKFLKKD